MSVKVEKLDGGMAKLIIEVAEADFAAACEKAYQKQKNKITIPGFRKGKAPKAMIEKMYGKEIFFEDAANEVIPDAYDKAYEECGEDIVSTPKIDVVQLEAGKPFIFSAEVALKPEVTLGKYKGVKVEKIDTAVSDEDVDKAVEEERERNARSIAVTDRPVKDKDDIILDFEGFVDGVAFNGGKGENYPLTIGSGQFIPGFEDQLIGKEIGTECEVNVTFPEDYQAEELKGKAAVFKCTVKEIKEKQLPDLDDEFASEVSEFDTLDEYKADVRKNLEDKKQAEAKNAKEDAVIKAIIEDAKMDIPEAMIETQKRQMLEEFAQRIHSQGLNFNQYMQFTGMTAEQMMEQVAPQAMDRIQSRLVLEAVAKAENLTATDEDFDKEVDKLAESYKMEKDKVVEMIGEEGKKQLLEDIAVSKAVEFVTENAKEGK
ncbi:MAG: trigger factor [Lachnospiraceae bacterium]|nr:trigger factor [Lachnospiraceae bacterium]